MVLLTQEVAMAAAYSMDLRARVLKDADAGRSSNELAERYHVSRAWVDALKQRRRETGTIAPRQQTKFRERVLAGQEDRLAALIVARPDATLAELREALPTTAGLSTLWRTIDRLGFTAKKSVGTFLDGRGIRADSGDLTGHAQVIRTRSLSQKERSVPASQYSVLLTRWSVSTGRSGCGRGAAHQNDQDAYPLNKITAQKNADGSVTIQYGGCGRRTASCLPITPGWNYWVRLYRPRAEILKGTWKFPDAQPVE